MRTWAHWTTTELKKLKDEHGPRLPSYEELKVIFPRHSVEGIRHVAMAHNLRLRKRNWLKIAQKYSADRGDRALVRA